MLVIISDACVLIDMIQSKLISAMFSLPYQFAVPDTLFVEELEERHAELLALGLICQSMSGELVQEAYLLKQQYTKPSVNDLLALTLAKHKGSSLLTGDKALREVAANFNIVVHGTIWLVEQLITQQKITSEVAALAFQKMKAAGSRLPWAEVENMLQRVSDSLLDKAFVIVDVDWAVLGSNQRPAD
jgi:predicted nucleic acid-binding protein